MILFIILDFFIYHTSTTQKNFLKTSESCNKLQAEKHLYRGVCSSQKQQISNTIEAIAMAHGCQIEPIDKTQLTHNTHDPETNREEVANNQKVSSCWLSHSTERCYTCCQGKHSVTVFPVFSPVNVTITRMGRYAQEYNSGMDGKGVYYTFLIRLKSHFTGKHNHCIVNLAQNPCQEILQLSVVKIL